MCVFFSVISFSVRVSNELGKARPRAAEYSVYVTVVESLLLGLLFMVAIFFAKDHFAVIFTSSVTVQKYVAKLAYLLGITMVLNSVQPVISGEELKIHSPHPPSLVGEDIILNYQILWHSCVQVWPLELDGRHWWLI